MAKAPKKKISKAKQKYIEEYKKQRKRIRSIEYRLRKKGIDFVKQEFPTIKEIKQYETRVIKKSIINLGTVTAKSYEKRTVKREDLPTPAEKPQEGDFTLAHIYDALSTATEDFNKEAADYAQDFIDDTIAEDGIEVVAQRIKDASQEAYRIAFEMVGDSDPKDVFNSLYSLCYIINGGELPKFFAIDHEIKKNALVRQRNHAKYVKYHKKRRI